MYNAYITKISEINSHPNADRLNIATVFDNKVIVDKTYNTSDLYIYFPIDGQLSEQYCNINNLVRMKDENGNDYGGYLDATKRNIKALKLRGEFSEGLLMPITSLSSFGDIEQLKQGDTVETFNGIEIACKYIPNINHPKQNNSNKGQKCKKKIKYNFVFPEHIDTPQLKYYKNNFSDGDILAITEKLDGSSGRSALVKTYYNSWFRSFLHLPKKEKYIDVCGSRRVVVSENSNGGFYRTNDFRMDIHNQIKPHLLPNMEVFYEIVGWTGKDGSPIMGEVDTTCLGNKEFSKKYGKKMTFNYGCEVGTYDFYIYRICLLDNDGDVMLEYSTDQIITWCNKNGFKYVPVLARIILKNNDDISKIADYYADGESTLGKHWREGCVLRIENHANKFDVYKNKNNAYKLMKGMFVESVQTDDISEDILSEM